MAVDLSLDSLILLERLWLTNFGQSKEWRTQLGEKI